jgi:hypothetical protein
MSSTTVVVIDERKFLTVFQPVLPLQQCANPAAAESAVPESPTEPLHSVADYVAAESIAEPHQSVADSAAAGYSD